MTQSFPGVLVAICFAASVVAQPIAQQADQRVDPRVPATHSRLETSPDRELKPQMNKWQHGRRKRVGPLIPLMAIGAIVLLVWLIAPRT